MQSYIIFNLFLLTCIIVLAICFKSYSVKNKDDLSKVVFIFCSNCTYKLNNYENIVMTDEEYAKIKENYKEIPATQYNLNDNNVINIVEQFF